MQHGVPGLLVQHGWGTLFIVGVARTAMCSALRAGQALVQPVEVGLVVA